MKYRIAAYISIIVLTGCAGTAIQQRTELPPPLPEAQINTDTGEEVARHLTSRYAAVTTHCGTVSQPAFLCNGIMIRGTSYREGRYAWDNSPANHESGGVSFSYLRKDSVYRKLAYGYTNGYIFEPYTFAVDKVHPEVMCSFPVDASTSRREDKGCGVNPTYAGSGLCAYQGISTAQQWWQHYQRVPSASRRSAQCGFEVRDELNWRAGPAFIESLAAMALAGKESFDTQNELRLAVWADGSGTSLPLEAFFYTVGNAGEAQGRSDAQHNQRDFLKNSRIWVPVISIKLPAIQGVDATFRYSAADQGVTP